MLDLQQNFVDAGGSTDDYRFLANGGMELGDDTWMDASADGQACREVALSRLAPGSLIEYHCYDNRGRPQGLAVVKFEGWIAQAKLEFRGVHLAASDDYYEWYGANALKAGTTVYHLCENARRSCKSRGAGGGEYLHLSRWRRVSPKLLVGVGYASEVGVKELEVLLSNFLAAHQAPPPGVPASAAAGPSGANPRRGGHRPSKQTTGLDAALKAGKDDDGVEDEADESVDRLGR